MSDLSKEQKILYDELSNSHAKYIANMPFLEDWIIDAMKRYADLKIKEQANGADKSTDQALHKHIVSNNEERVAVCELPEIGIDKICFKCGKHISEHKFPEQNDC